MRSEVAIIGMTIRAFAPQTLDLMGGFDCEKKYLHNIYHCYILSKKSNA